MRQAQELSPAELATIVNSLQQMLYLDFGDQNQPIWNPDKSWEGADVCDQLARLLADHDLVPQSVIAVSSNQPSHPPEHNHELNDSGAARRAADRRSRRSFAQLDGGHPCQSQRLGNSQNTDPGTKIRSR